MKQTINGAELRRLILSAAASIEINKQQLNDLNVFPVPDGDTGTNMAMTINTAATDCVSWIIPAWSRLPRLLLLPCSVAQEATPA